jgi:polyhydroxyalkanoate synthase
MTKSKPHKFILSASGHIRGVFNHPDSKKYHFWMADELPEDADEWLEGAKKIKGSWWKAWREWLKAYEGDKITAQAVSKEWIIEKAPGRYALSNVMGKNTDT